MQALQVLGLSIACLTLYLSSVDAECSGVEKAKITTCVEAFDIGLGDKSERERRIAAGNMSCPKDLIEDDCGFYSVMDTCMNALGFPDDCEAEITAELKNDKIECTYDELKMICAGSAVMYSISLLFISLFAAAFRQH